MTNSRSRCISIDPGTRNLGLCSLEYDEAGGGAPVTMEQFLGNISLRHLALLDMDTAHVNTACVRVRNAFSPGGDAAWVTEEFVETAPITNVCIEKQGQSGYVVSPISYLCHALFGFFLGIQATWSLGARDTPPTYGTIYIDYQAAHKFRGDWTEVQPRGGTKLEIEVYGPRGGVQGSSDPVKRAAVEACERILTWFRVGISPEHLRHVRAQVRQHDMCDCILQGVSFLFKFHVQKLGDTAQRARPSLTLPVTNPTLVTETLLGQPRQGRAKSKQSSAKRSNVARAKEQLPEATTARGVELEMEWD